MLGQWSANLCGWVGGSVQNVYGLLNDLKQCIRHYRLCRGASRFAPRGPFHRVAQIYLRDQWRDLLRAPVCFVLSVSFGGISARTPFRVFLPKLPLRVTPCVLYGFLPWNTVFGVSGQTCVSESFSTLRVEKPKQHHLCGCCVWRCVVL